MKVTAAQNTYQYVVFRLSKEIYGFEIKFVTTIEKLMPITRVPKTPSFIKGVINLRGEIIPVMCLRERFGLGAVEETDETRIVIVKVGEFQVGMIVDVVEEVLQLTEDSTESVSGLSNSISMNLINGVGKVDGKVVALLNMEELVDISEKTEE
jgi:purine-binding chemotaxis protein CheW